eukprot:TRINITY_DN6018_c0_g2_i2.p1 TRINITY_DN6018_c0_g2~~TRINITY_DN6018_c0_g2_i2.p1  ORF type:complete len:382 (+),score=66.91 TRINITY_DN6018_c0_g2_i2:50-1195(+)
MIRRPPRSTQSRSSAASDVYKRQYQRRVHGEEKMYSRRIICLLLVSLSLVASQECLKKAQEYAILLNNTALSVASFQAILNDVNGCCYEQDNWCRWTWTHMRDLANYAISEDTTLNDQRLPALQETLARTIATTSSPTYLDAELRKNLDCTRGTVDCQNQAKTIFRSSLSNLKESNEERMNEYRSIMDLGQNSNCFSQSPRCLGLLALTSINYVKLNYTYVCWAPEDMHARLFHSYIEACMSSVEPTPPSPQPEPENACLNHLLQTQKRVNDSINTKSSYDQRALELRGARTLALRFSQCVANDNTGVYSSLCVQLSKSLPNIITTAIFSSTPQDQKRRANTVVTDSIDLVEICSTSPVVEGQRQQAQIVLTFYMAFAQFK